MSPRRTTAVAAGLLSIAVLSLATDQLACRLVFGVIGGYITAKLAPYAPMHHAVILGMASFVFSAITTPLDPVLVLTALPATAAGGILYCVQSRDHRERSVIPFLVPYTFRLPDFDDFPELDSAAPSSLASVRLVQSKNPFRGS